MAVGVSRWYALTQLRKPGCLLPEEWLPAGCMLCQGAGVRYGQGGCRGLAGWLSLFREARWGMCTSTSRREDS